MKFKLKGEKTDEEILEFSLENNKNNKCMEILINGYVIGFFGEDNEKIGLDIEKLEELGFDINIKKY